MASQLDGLDAYIDEERALGFNVWVGELELLVGTAKGRQVDQVAAFELLQKVLVTIDTTDLGRVREYQRRCELALVDILLKGAASPVRRLVCMCMSQLYAVGDTLPMYSRVSGLRSLLTAKEARSLAEPVRTGVLQCLAALCQRHGRVLASSMTETLGAALKHAGKGSEPPVRTAALVLVASVVSGLGAGDRSTLPVQSDALKCAIRSVKDHMEPSAAHGRMAAASILRAIAQAEGAAFWGNLSAYEEAVKLCNSLLEDENRASADAFAGVLGEVAGASRSRAAREAAKSLEKKSSKKNALDQALKEAFSVCIVAPFTEAAIQGRTRVCTALTQAWLAYLSSMQRENPGDDEGLVDWAARALEMLASIASSPPVEEGEPEFGWFLSSGEMPHAQACVLYIVRVGVIERLGETGQRKMLERLTAMLASVLGAHVPLAVASLEALGLLLEVLGEISLDQLDSLEAPVLDKLLASSSCLRRQAAGLVGAMSVAEQSSAARLLSQRLNSLAEAANKMAAVCGHEPSSAPSQEPLSPGTPRGLDASEAAKLKPAMDPVHGNALGVAALLVATARLPLGVPSQLPLRALALAEQLITQPKSRRAAGKAVEREAGYIILGALCISLPTDAIMERKQNLIQLWQPALATESVAELDLRKYLTISQAKAELSMSQELWWRAAALEALKALLLSPLVACGTAEAGKLQRRMAAILQPTLSAVLGSPVLQDPHRAKGVLGAASAHFQLRLLEAYLALPNPNTFATEHQALSKLCTRAFRGYSAQSSGVPGVPQAAASSTLRMLLNRQDAPLGPWVAGRGPLEDALQSFAGAPGGPPQHPWEAGLPSSVGYAGSLVQLQADDEPFPQPRSLAAALLERQLVLLGSLLAVVSEPNQLQILDVMTSAATGPPTKRREKESPQRRQAVLTSVCCAALAGLDSLARKYRGEVESRDAVAERARILAEAALAEGVALVNVALLRSSAEMYALAACIGSDANAIQLLRNLCSTMASTSAPPRRAALALALGCVYRSKGGMALQGTISTAAETLLAVARGSSGATHIWLLHALGLVANAAGLSLVPSVKDVLALEMDLLMSEEASAVPGLRPALGRLANAMVAVLGPELSLGSAAYTRTRSLLQDLQSLGSEAVSAEEATMAELERVLYAQMLVLFAPQAVPAIAHVPLLLTTLKSRQPALRKAAADTMRHLAEGDPEAILPARIETTLFTALDNETDAGTAAQLKATLLTLLAAGAQSRPSYYLTTCSAIILAANAAATSKGSAATTGGQPKTLQEDEDSDADEESPQQVEARRSSNSVASTSGQILDAAGKAAPTTRLRTRTFAASCLLDLPVLVGPDRRHFDTLAAQEATTGDWLILQLQSLIDVAFKMATGTVEALKPDGVKLLKTVLHYFGDAQDPLLEGSRLLEQSQAQYVAALRSALSTKAAPTLAAAGAALAADFIKSGLTEGDSNLLARLMTMLTDPFAAIQEPNQEVYAEWVGGQAQVALLTAAAICVGHLLSSPDLESQQIVVKAQKAHSGILMDLWPALLQDWLILSTQKPQVQAAYKPRLFAAPSPSVLATVKPFLEEAWSPILAAVCSVLGATADQSDTNERPPDVSSRDYLLLVDVCRLVISNAASSRSLPSIQPGELAVGLAGLHSLLSPRFFQGDLCDMGLCREAVSLVGALAQQVGEGQYKPMPGAVAAASDVLSQACSAAPTAYLADPSVVGTLAAATAAFLELPLKAEGAENVSVGCTALKAATNLLTRAEQRQARIIQPGLLIGGISLLKQSSEGDLLVAVSDFILKTAKAAAEASTSLPGDRAEADGGPPNNVVILAYAALGAADALRHLLPEHEAPATGPPDHRRLELTLNLVLASGALLPSTRQLPRISLLQLTEPAPREAAATIELAEATTAVTEAAEHDAAAVSEDDWDNDAPFHEAASGSGDSWGDANFQAAGLDSAESIDFELENYFPAVSGKQVSSKEVGAAASNWSHKGQPPKEAASEASDGLGNKTSAATAFEGSRDTAEDSNAEDESLGQEQSLQAAHDTAQCAPADQERSQATTAEAPSTADGRGSGELIQGSSISLQGSAGNKELSNGSTTDSYKPARSEFEDSTGSRQGLWTSAAGSTLDLSSHKDSNLEAPSAIVKATCESASPARSEHDLPAMASSSASPALAQMPESGATEHLQDDVLAASNGADTVHLRPQPAAITSAGSEAADRAAEAMEAPALSNSQVFEGEGENGDRDTMHRLSHEEEVRVIEGSSDDGWDDPDFQFAVAQPDLHGSSQSDLQPAKAAGEQPGTTSSFPMPEASPNEHSARDRSTTGGDMPASEADPGSHASGFSQTVVDHSPGMTKAIVGEPRGPFEEQPVHLEEPEAPVSHAEEDSAAVPEELQQAQESCLQALQACLREGNALSVHATALQAIRAYAQEVATGKAAGDRAEWWALACATAVIQPAAGNLQHSLRKTAGTELSPHQLVVASETLKLLNSIFPLASRLDSRMEGRLLALLVQLLVVCAAPKAGTDAHPVLLELVRRLMTLLAGGRFGAAFRSALTSLSPQSRQRLQAALQAQPAGAPQTAKMDSQDIRQPTIALKTFAALKPPPAF